MSLAADGAVSDAIIAELWRIKDAMAREHGYDVEALAAHVRGREQSRRAGAAKTGAAPTATRIPAEKRD